MIALSKLKRDIEISRSLGDIIDVLKTAATIQLQALQTREKPDETFLKDVEEAFSLLSPKKLERHPYFFKRARLPSAILLITSDEGFLGELNTVLIRAALAARKDKADQIIVLGERGARYLEEAGENFLYYPGISDEVKYPEASSVRDYLLRVYRRKFGAITVVYPRFVTLVNQKVETFRFLPYDLTALKARRATRVFEDALIEPSASSVLESLIWLWAGATLFDMFWSAKQSEYAARIMHLEGSTHELKQVNRQLSLEYFRQIHALRDKSIREISASKNLLGKRRA